MTTSNVCDIRQVLLLVVWTAKMVRPVEYATVQLSSEEVCACWPQYLKEADNNISLIVGNPQGILEQLLRPRPIHLLNTIIVFIYYIKFSSIKLF